MRSNEPAGAPRRVTKALGPMPADRAELRRGRCTPCSVGSWLRSMPRNRAHAPSRSSVTWRGTMDRTSSCSMRSWTRSRSGTSELEVPEEARELVDGMVRELKDAGANARGEGIRARGAHLPSDRGDRGDRRCRRDVLGARGHADLAGSSSEASRIGSRTWPRRHRRPVRGPRMRRSARAPRGAERRRAEAGTDGASHAGIGSCR